MNTILSPKRLFCVAVLGLLLAGANFLSAHAHDSMPLAPPALPACRPALNRCESPLVNAPAAAIELLRPITETLGLADAPDGKGLLPHTHLLTAQAALSAIETPLRNIPCINGFADVYPCKNVDLLAYMPPAELGSQSSGNDLWGWRDPVTQKEYALVGRTDGMAFVDVTNPLEPLLVGRLPTYTGVSVWRGVKVYKDHAFIVADRNGKHGMQVFDLTQLRSVAAPPAIFSAVAHYANFDSAHNIAINEETGYAYAVGSNTCGSGLHIINIQDINNPVQAGCYGEDGYIHDTQCVTYRGPDLIYQGREICFNSSVTTFTIVDVSDKKALRRLSSWKMAGNVYIHQGWLTADQRYFLINDEMDETFFDHNSRTYILDVGDLDKPTLVGVYTGKLPAIDHNLYISDTYVYEANYTIGLRVLDIQDVATGILTETAYFDTYPENDDATFASAWIAYPYFASGAVIVNTLDRGIFILKPRLPAGVLLTTAQQDFALCTASVDVGAIFTTTLDLRPRNGYTQTASLQPVGLPTGSAVTFTPNLLDLAATPHATSTVIANFQQAAPGQYNLTIHILDTDQTPMDTQPLQVHVANAAPAPPTITAPMANAQEAALPITFAWAPQATAHTYRLEVATDAAFTNLVFTQTVNTSTYNLAAPLNYDQDYFWRVFALNRCGQSNATPAQRFHTPLAVLLPFWRR